MACPFCDLDSGAIVDRYVIIAEVIDPDGPRSAIYTTADGATKWDTLGLLQWAMNEEASDQTKSAMVDE